MPRRTESTAPPLDRVYIVHTGAWPVPGRVYGIYRTRREALVRTYSIEADRAYTRVNMIHIEEVRLKGGKK